MFLYKHYLTFFSNHLGLFNLFPSFSKLPKPRLHWVKRSKGRGAHHKNIFVFLMSNQNFQVFSCLIFKTRLKVKSRFRFDFDLTVTHLLRCNRNLNEVNAMCKRARKTSFLLHGIKHRLHLKSMLKYLLQASLLTQMFIIL